MAKEYSGEYQHFIRKAMPSDLYPNAYNLKLIESMDELKSILETPTDYIAFDTETNGLNPEQNHIVGYSFCMDGKNAYYVAVDHAVGDSNLGLDALDLIYNKLVNTKVSLMFNMRFDCRMMEYTGFDTDELPLDQRWKKTHFRYDMTKVNVMDVQALVYLADTNKKYPSLKWAEEWFLGWRGASFEDTLGAAENFEYLDPKECYRYAATDALGTFLLFPKVYPFYQEAKTSGQLDNNCLMPLMRYEEETLLFDVDKLKSYAAGIDEEIEKVQQECWAIVGFPFNLGSPKEKSQIFDRLGISTGERNTRGEWKSGEDNIDYALQGMNKDDPNYKLLSNLVRFAHLKKQKTSYVDNIIEMCNNDFHPGRLRFSYKTTEVPSGRLAAGGDKKNPYFASLNIQNIPKPHVEMWYYITYKEALQHLPEIQQLMYDENGKEKRDWEYTYREITSDGVQSEKVVTMTRILDWVFANQPFNIPGVQEYIIEGFKQDRNIRSCIMPDEGRYWVSIDYAAEELRIAALISGEQVWTKVFCEDGDVHESCYSLDTEFLTKDGFKTYDQITPDTLIAQYDAWHDMVTYVPAGPAYFNETKTMYHFKGRATDLLVTPNHRMLYINQKEQPLVLRADELYKLNKVSVINNAPVQSSTSYPKIIHISGTTKHPSIDIPIRTYVKLIGLLLTDGATFGKGHKGQIKLTQCDTCDRPHLWKHQKYIEVMNEINHSLGDIFEYWIEDNRDNPVDFKDYQSQRHGKDHNWYINHINLWQHLVDNFGGPLKLNKYLPTWFKSLPQDILEEFIYTYSLGDGTFDNRQNRTSFTIFCYNPRMASDLQEVLFKCGYITRYEDNSIMCQKQKYTQITKDNYSIIEYDEPVKSVCYSVPSSFLVVRRNGKITICGNTAKAIWGEDKYNKDLRKLAKGANFGILYGQNEYNFADKFDGDIDKSREFLQQYKSSLPTLFRWVSAHQRQSQQRGLVTTYFGRPIRTKSYFDSDDYKKVAYARRLSVNATIQGTGADVLKIAFMKLWKTIFSNENNREKVKFCLTVHDEINYQITKEDTKMLVPIILKCMRLQLPGWPFPLDVGLSIGNRWGMDFDFIFDPNTFEIIGPKGDPYNPERKVKIVENDNHQTWEDKETEIEYEMPTIEF